MNKRVILNLLKESPSSSTGADSSHITSTLTSTPITQAFKSLYDHKVHSLPVKDAKSQKFVQFLDLVDIIHHLFSSFSDKELEHLQIPKITEWKGQYIQVLGEKEHYTDHSQQIPDPEKINYFASKTVAEVAKGPWVSVKENESLESVVEAFMGKKHVHRVAVEGANHSLSRIITQSDIVKYLFANIEKLGESANLTVGQMKLEKLHPQLFKINPSTVALEGFKLMNEKGIEGLPVVDDNGKLVGNLSLSDMRLIVFNASEILYLYLSTSEYLQKMHKKDSSLPNKEVSVTVNSTLGEVLATLVKNRVHRVYVVDDQNNLVSLITIGDLLRSIHHNKL